MAKKTEGSRRRGVGERGFTLIELMIVVVILGILIGIAMPNFLAHAESARRASCVSNQRQLMVATALYSADHNLLNGTINSTILNDGGYVTPQLCDCPTSAELDMSDYDITLINGRVAWTTCLIAGADHAVDF